MQTAKKILLSLATIIVFGAYSFAARHDVVEHAVLPPRATTSTTTNPTATPRLSTGASYKDGAYTGIAADAVYGNIQVQVTIQHGSITDVVFLQYPNDRQTSININAQAMPLLKQEALQAQNAHVDTVTGATYTSEAFVQSLSSALAQA